MGEPRRFKIRVDEERTYTAQIAGPLLPLNEAVEVIEAVLTDELVEKVARALYVEAQEDRDWADANEVDHDGYFADARAALRAAGFQGPGDTDGH